MDKIYCISTGDYSAWRIVYSFKDKKKRDDALKVLGEDYSKYDITLDDDGIDIDGIYNFYIVKITNYHNSNRIEDFKVDYLKLNSLADGDRSLYYLINNKNELFSMRLVISESEYKKGNEHYKREYYNHKWIKAFRDTQAKIDYMVSEGMSSKQVSETLNGAKCEG